MRETPEELDSLQALLDSSMAAAGSHLRDIIGPDRRLDARQLTERLWGMRLRGPSFAEWMDGLEALGTRIAPEKMFTFSMG